MSQPGDAELQVAARSALLDALDALARQREALVLIGAQALAQLEEAGILTKLNERKWGRVWECGELLKLVDDFEKALSTP